MNRRSFLRFLGLAPLAPALQCAWCQKPVEKGQPRVPLGGGRLLDSFGQFEHPECQAKRFERIREVEASARNITDTLYHTLYPAADP
jgi:hypothetical protein